MFKLWCDIFNTKGAEFCENWHVGMEGIQQEDYEAQEKFPAAIVVKGNDGTLIEYKYNCHTIRGIYGTDFYVGTNEKSKLKNE